MNTITRLNAALWGLRAALAQNVRYLNDGGCGHFAYRAAQALEARGFEVEVVTDGCSEDEAPANGFHGKHHLGVRLRHNGVIYTFDSQTGLRKTPDRFGKLEDRGVPNQSCPARCKYPFGMGMSPDEAEEFVNTEDWNSMFDTDQLPVVEQLIEKYLH